METRSAPLAVIALVADDRTVPLGAVPARRCDLQVLDALLRLCLAARRTGVSIRLTDVHPDLRDLAELAGVTEHLGIT